MALLEIKTHPNEVLERKAEPVKEVTDELKTLAADMFETMYANQGIGLAAPQVGRSIRMVVLDPKAGTEEQGQQQYVLINPEIVQKRGSIIWEEGCLSLPGIMGRVKRANQVVVEATNLEGEVFQVEGDELLAVLIQHELDHLEGILFINRVSPLQKKFLLKDYLRKGKDAQSED